MWSLFWAQSIYICWVLYRIQWPVRAFGSHYSTKWPSNSFLWSAYSESRDAASGFLSASSPVLAYWEEPRKYPLISFTLKKSRLTALWSWWDIPPPSILMWGLCQVGEWGWTINTWECDVLSAVWWLNIFAIFHNMHLFSLSLYVTCKKCINALNRYIVFGWLLNICLSIQISVGEALSQRVPVYTNKRNKQTWLLLLPSIEYLPLILEIQAYYILSCDLRQLCCEICLIDPFTEEQKKKLKNKDQRLVYFPFSTD